MANKKKRKRQRLAAARKSKEQGVSINPKPKKVWCPLTAQWKDVEEPMQLRTYNVAAQIRDNGPVFQAYYKASNEVQLIKLICMNLSVSQESDFAFLEIHLQREEGGVEVIREGDKWPAGVGIIRSKGVIQAGNFGEAKRVPPKESDAKIIVPEIKSSARPRDPPTTSTVVPVTEVTIERKIPRVSYTLKLAS